MDADLVQCIAALERLKAKAVASEDYTRAASLKQQIESLKEEDTPAAASDAPQIPPSASAAAPEPAVAAKVAAQPHRPAVLNTTNTAAGSIVRPARSPQGSKRSPPAARSPTAAHSPTTQTPELSFTQKLRRRERGKALGAQRSAAAMCESPLSSPEDIFGCCITGEDIQRVRKGGGSFSQSGKLKSQQQQPAGASTLSKIPEKKSTGGKIRDRDRLTNGVRRDMNKSRLTRYAEACKKPSRRNVGFGGIDTNLHSVGVDPHSKAQDHSSSPQWDELPTAGDMPSLAHSKTSRKMAAELAETKSKGTTREVVIYGVVAGVCLMSGRLDASAIVMRLVCCVLVALVMRANKMVQF